MITGLAHVCISSGDLEATERFYCGILGCKKKFEFIRNSSRVGFYIELGKGAFLEVFSSGQPVAHDPSLFRHICLEVDDIESAITKLRAGGVEVGDRKLGSDQSYQAWLKDPNGMPIELHQYTLRSSQLTGADCILD